MAHLWRFEDDDWTILPLCDEAYLLDEWPPAGVAGVGDWLDAQAESGALTPHVALTRAPTPAGPGWVVMTSTPRAACVNGLPVLAGIRVLADRDELRVDDGDSMFFSIERLAELSSLPETQQEICCPRCRDVIRAATPAVQCPQCDVWHHQEADRPCWTYADGCAACGHPTALDAGFTWTPES
jgi:hypothetical protein